MTDAGGAMAPDQPIMRGAAMICAAMFLYGIMDSTSKWLTADYHPTQILLIRALLACMLVSQLSRSRGGWAVVRTKQPALQALRAIVSVSSMMCMVFAYSLLPLAETVAIVYSAPILVTVLSIPILGEKVGVRRMTACAVGFCGVLLIARPGSTVFQTAALFAVASMVGYAVSVVLTRRLGRTDRGVTTLIYTQFAYLLICVPAQAVYWVTPTSQDWILFIAVGGAGAVAQFLMVSAYSSSPASALAPFDFTAMIWSAAFGFAIWGEFPDPLALSGIAIVMCAGLYIAHREFRVSPPRNLGAVYLALRRPFR